MKIHKIVNASTGEIIERPYTEEEMQEYESNLILKQEREELEQQRQEARQEILDRLGITAEEAQLLIGGN